MGTSAAAGAANAAGGSVDPAAPMPTGTIVAQRATSKAASEPATANTPPGTTRPKSVSRSTSPARAGRKVLARDPQPKRAHACTSVTSRGRSARQPQAEQASPAAKHPAAKRSSAAWTLLIHPPCSLHTLGLPAPWPDGYRFVTSRRPAAVAARNRSASSSVNAPRASFQRQLP